MPMIANQTHHVKPTHKELIKNHLLAGHSITQAEFCQMTSLASRLAPRILNLRDEVYPIINLNEGKKGSDGADKFAKYVLPHYFLIKVATYGLDIALRGELLAKGVSR